MGLPVIHWSSSLPHSNSADRLLALARKLDSRSLVRGRLHNSSLELHVGGFQVPEWEKRSS